MNQKLDEMCERIVDNFNAEITELTNDECEYVLRELVAKFDSLLERVTEANNE